jgi:hypothetical protein
LNDNKEFNAMHLSAICGSGKSYNIIKNINEFPLKVIYSVPTIQLGKEIAAKIPDATFLKSGEGYNIGEEFSTNIKQGFSRVLIVTHKALEILGAIASQDEYLQEVLSEWTVYVDEVICPFMLGELYIKKDKNFKMVLGHLVSDGAKMLPKDDESFAALESLLTEGQMFSQPLKELLYTLVNGGTVIQRKNEKTGEGYKIIYCVFNPAINVFKHGKNAIFISANAENSPMVSLISSLSKGEVEGVSEKLMPAPERRLHKNTDRVKVNFYIGKNVGLHSLGRDKEVLYRTVVDKIGAKVAERKFIYATNSDKPTVGKFKTISDKSFNGLFKGERVGFTSMGINIYSGLVGEDEMRELGIQESKIEEYKDGYDTAVWLGVAKMNPEHKMIITDLLTNYSEKTAAAAPKIIESMETFAEMESCYQFCMRTKLRDVNNTDPIELHVLTKTQAEYLKKHYFHDAELIDETIDMAQFSKATKGNDTKSSVQACKLKGMKQKAVSDHLGISLVTVKRNWN